MSETIDEPFDLLKIDGIWGPRTTRAAQLTWGVAITGRVIRQIIRRRQDHPGLADGWEFDGSEDDEGDELIRAFQEVYELEPTGHLDGQLVREFQRRMAAGDIDGKFSRPSPAIKEFQRRLNTGDAAGV